MPADGWPPAASGINVDKQTGRYTKNLPQAIANIIIIIVIIIITAQRHEIR